ncbi:hypothetical protein Q5692_04995 [Microcoleus sp. C2C3]
MLKEEGSSATDYVTDVTDGRKMEEGSAINLKLKPTIDIVFSPKIYRFWE